MDGAQVRDPEQFVVALEGFDGGAVMGVAGNANKAPFSSSARAAMRLSRPRCRPSTVMGGDPAAQGSLHHATIHSLRVGRFEDRAMLGISLDRDDRAEWRGERAHLADQANWPRVILAPAAASAFHAVSRFAATAGSASSTPILSGATS